MSHTATARNEAELRFALHVKIVEELATLAKNGFWVFCVCYLGYWFFQMLASVSQSDEGSIAALAKVVEKFSLDRIVLCITNAVTGVGWYRSRSRNKRLTKQLGEKRHKREENDPVNDRSGLDEYGQMKGE